MKTLSEQPDTTYASRVRWADLAGRPHGPRDASGHAFVFLHGLTFDHRMWDPVLEALPADHHAIALDLPGHGGSPALRLHDLEVVADAIHEAVLDGGLESPIVVGHSIGGPIASIYGVKYPAAAVVTVDSPARIQPFAELVHSLAGQLDGEGFEQTWAMFHESMHIERVPENARALVELSDGRTREQVTSYWRGLFEMPPEEIVRWVEQRMSQARGAALPYLALHGNAIDTEERAYLSDRLPQAEIVVWPVGHHFPHLADPIRFAALLTGLAAGLPAPRRVASAG